MRAGPTGFQWAVVGITCAVVTALLAHPQALPMPVRSGVSEAVDGVARTVLYLWDEPADGLKEPDGVWKAGPSLEPANPAPNQMTPVGWSPEVPGSLEWSSIISSSDIPRS
jgi:hypothetical protein